MKRIIYTILIVFLLTTISITYPNVKADSTEVIMYFYKTNIDHIIGPNGSNELDIEGRVTCNFGDIDEEYLDIQVNIWVDDEYNWTPAITPETIIFPSDGYEEFLVKLFIPNDVHNRTENRVTVSGSWRTNQLTGSSAGGYGTLGPETCTVKINRTTLLSGINVIVPEYEEYVPWWEEMEPEHILALILTPIIIVIIIVIAFLYKRKKFYDWLSEKYKKEDE